MTESTSLINIQLPKANISMNPDFKRVLNEIPSLNQESSKLQQTNIDDLNEDDITNLNKKMRDVAQYDKAFKGARKALRDAFNQPRDQVIAWYDQQLDLAGYQEFEDNIKRNKQLRRDVIANRANKRWAELKSIFNASLEAYPKIKQYAPQLANFNNFRIRHPKLVSGAKTKKINDDTRSVVTHEVANYNNAILDIEKNTAKLLPSYKQQLLITYVNNPTSETLVNQTRILSQKQAADLAAQQAAKEAVKKQATAQPTQPPLQSVQPQPQVINDYTWLLNYIQSFKNGRNIHNNDRVKANLCYEMYHNFYKKGTIWNQHIGNDFQKLIAVNQYILNL